MAVVLGTTITLATAIAMAASAGAVAADIAKIVQALKEGGHDPQAPLPVDAQLGVQKALDALPQPPPADFGPLGAADRVHVDKALNEVRSVYIASEAVGQYRAKALTVLYQLAYYLDSNP